MGRKSASLAPLFALPLLVPAWEISSAGPLAAQTPSAEAVDRIFQEWDREGSPGCAVGVYRAGELALARGYGEANLDWGLPITPGTAFYSGSVSKQFTAALAALLHLDGALDLDEDVRRIIPELPPYDPPVTLRQLVHHTSGVRDTYGLIALSGGRTADAWTDDEYLELLARQTTLNHEPGSAHLYSNGGYYLITTALERVSGMRLDELAREWIFGPLGMDDTHFHQDRERIVPRRAMSYGGDAEDGFRQTYLGNFDKVGAGGLYTTIEDLAAWDRNFITGEVGGAEFIRLMEGRGFLSSGDTLTYAFGLVHGALGGRPIIGHSGSFMGFRADYVRLPDEGLSVAALCNLGGINPGELTRAVARVTLGIPEEGGAGAEDGASGSGEEEGQPEPSSLALARYAGSYWSAEVENGAHVRWNGRRLHIRRSDEEAETPLEWLGGDRFRAGGWTVDFVVNGGEVEALVVDAGRVRNLRFARSVEEGG